MGNVGFAHWDIFANIERISSRLNPYMYSIFVRESCIAGTILAGRPSKLVRYWQLIVDVHSAQAACRIGGQSAVTRNSPKNGVLGAFAYPDTSG
jgi:hypothetical protein